MKKLAKTILILSVLLFPAITPSYASAACTVTGNDAKKQVLNGVGSAGGDCNGDNTVKIFKTAVNILSLVVGIVAVIMVIVGGFRYITSAGDSGKVASAKNTIIWALIGLVIVAFAQTIVKFVINKAQV